MMSSVFDGISTTDTLRKKKPKETSSKARTSRVPFGNDAIKALGIRTAAFEYNYGMGAIDEYDHLISQNPGLLQVREGDHQAIEYWLLREYSATVIGFPRDLRFHPPSSWTLEAVLISGAT